MVKFNPKKLARHRSLLKKSNPFFCMLAIVLLAFPLEACLGPQLDADNPYERHLALIALRKKPALVKATSAALSDPDWRIAATASALALKHSLRHP